jgi:hypothetical protein
VVIAAANSLIRKAVLPLYFFVCETHHFLLSLRQQHVRNTQEYLSYHVTKRHSYRATPLAQNPKKQTFQSENNQFFGM